jgi:hypothetical protein
MGQGPEQPKNRLRELELSLALKKRRSGAFLRRQERRYFTSRDGPYIYITLPLAAPELDWGI